MALLEVCDVSKRFGGLLALQGVQYSIEPGQITGLIGPNGAGKTTLFNCIAGECTPDRGRILFQGTPSTACRVMPSVNGALRARFSRGVARR
jgi:ABC-type branched-subunit amino acid transport system ATPase component